MSQFPDREAAEEQRFVHEQEMAFKVSARRNALIGLWVGELLGLPKKQCTAYSNELVQLASQTSGESRLLAKLKADLGPLGISEHRIRNELDHQSAIARASID